MYKKLRRLSNQGYLEKRSFLYN